MPRPSNQISISLRLEQSLLDRIDAAAKARTVDRSAFIRMSVVSMLEGTTPAAQGGSAPSGDTDRALVLMLDRIEALEKKVAEQQDKIQAIEFESGPDGAPNTGAVKLLDRLMKAAEQ